MTGVARHCRVAIDMSETVDNTGADAAIRQQFSGFVVARLDADPSAPINETMTHVPEANMVCRSSESTITATELTVVASRLIVKEVFQGEADGDKLLEDGVLNKDALDDARKGYMIDLAGGAFDDSLPIFGIDLREPENRFARRLPHQTATLEMRDLSPVKKLIGTLVDLEQTGRLSRTPKSDQ